MSDYSELKRLDKHAEKKKSGSPMHFLACQRMSASATPAALLALIADVESLRDSATLKVVQSLRADCEDLRKDAERYRFAKREGIYLSDWDDESIDEAITKEKK